MWWLMAWTLGKDHQELNPVTFTGSENLDKILHSSVPQSPHL